MSAEVDRSADDNACKAMNLVDFIPERCFYFKEKLTTAAAVAVAAPPKSRRSDHVFFRKRVPNGIDERQPCFSEKTSQPTSALNNSFAKQTETMRARVVNRGRGATSIRDALITRVWISVLLFEMFFVRGTFF